MGRDEVISAFTALGRRLEGFGGDGRSRAVVERAMRENQWFTQGDIVRAADAVRVQMLDETKLSRWLSAYPPTPAHARNVGVIMAGNIPMVGFFDLLCVLAAGHACLYKPSSKDAAMMDYVVSELLAIAPEIPACLYVGQPLDAVVATGSDNTRRLMHDRFASIPTLLRGSRASVAVLVGDESSDELCALGDDVFAYSGLGCRNVSRVFLPADYDVRRLEGALNDRPSPSRGYVNNFVQRRAVLRMQGAEFVEGAHFLLREGDDFPSDISEIVYSFYTDRSDVAAWLDANDAQVQCVVCRDFGHPRTAAFGRAHAPALGDYPDGVDTMLFLAESVGGVAL